MDAAARSSPLALTVLALLHHEPLHPYGVQRLIKQWGKDQVVNVGQRASLYRTIERLHADGLIAVRETGRDQAYPERTVYELTDAGRRVARTWLRAMLVEPKQEFPQFPAALSHLAMISPAEAAELLERRADRIGQARQERAAALAAHADLPRVFHLEDEHLDAIAAAEERWLRSVVEDLRAGRLTWSAPAPPPADADPA
ncbi:PadR family transcriptional regulator [Micromonospora sp. A3M-1-15]|uniref:PadR family transcriptional regulator n=1 Tax=Micromonospora sp. A3M-1-15 TaxID=2962035 RepID=UPI0020B73FD6|nr:PadR family transcriptional regulator [Micromonospora sp. A3M-1-15]MCP3783191.1 PadR family transcriptional regulator [Micromonospora sp. A3M-1-15]